MILDKSYKSLVLQLGEVISAAQVEFVTHFEDEIQERVTPQNTVGVSNGVTEVILVAAPADNAVRTVKEITIFNADSIPHVVKVGFKVNGAVTKILAFTLQANETIKYVEPIGWSSLPINSSIYAPIANPIFTGLVTLLGGQIKFPGTKNPSSDPNTMDDYEEGTVTLGMTFGGSTAGIVFSRRSAKYTCIGDICVCIIDLATTTKGAAGSIDLTGIPFAIGTNPSFTAMPNWVNGMTGADADKVTGFSITNGASTLPLIKRTGGAEVLLDAADVNNAANYQGTVIYKV